MVGEDGTESTTIVNRYDLSKYDEFFSDLALLTVTTTIWFASLSLIKRLVLGAKFSAISS